MSTTITGLTDAALPLTGAERVPMDQGGQTVDATTQDIADLSPGTDLAYDAATRALTSSTGDDVTLPEATPSTPGLQSATDKTRIDQLASTESPTFAGLTATGNIQAATLAVSGTSELAHIHGNIAGNFYLHVRNTSGVTLPAGTAVYVTGSIGDTDRVTVAAADPTNSAKMPAVGVLESALTNNGDGNAVILGELRPINTAAYTLNQALYVGASGALTATQPTSGIVQAVGTVARVQSNTGTIVVHIGDRLGTAALRSVGTTAGTVAAGDDSRFAEFTARFEKFRDARTFYVSKAIGASDSNNGTSPGEPFLTIGAAVAAANTYKAANPSEFVTIIVGPGTFTEPLLPMRLAPNILVRSRSQRSVRIKPAPGQELNSFFALDSGCMLYDLTFVGHQAQNTSPTDSTVGTRAWVATFNEQANGGLGPIIYASPYIKDCLSLTAEDDTGEAGSTSTGDCGGGVEVDGAKCHPNSPIRSMVIYGFTQQNLGGPGAVIKNDAYAELVSFFGLFGTWHVRCETGGQATMSGGGCSEFGIYGLVADGYSPTAIFTGALRVAATAGDLTVDVVSLTANRLGTSSRPAAGQLMLLDGGVYTVQSSTPIDASGNVVLEGAVNQAGYRVTFYNPLGLGLATNTAQGTTADFRLRSQISAGSHSANFVGAGTNYSALPWNGGIPIRGNEAVESNFGRVFGLLVNDVGDVKVAGGAFEVDGTTGSVTINTSQFNLSGLNAVGPFSRNGGISTVGVQLQEVSNDPNLLASTGISEGDTAPTQYAVKAYLDANYSKSFYFEQLSASTTWTINHNLGYKPSVGTFNTGSQEVEGNVVHTSDNQTIVSFSTAVAGFARLT